MTEKYDLSRRKVLAGLSTIGIAGAAAGAGTSAYFSDEESFEDNELVAGELDLIVDYETTVDQGQAATGSTTGSGTMQGTAVQKEYRISDVKPGDSGSLTFCPKIVDNSGWLFAGSNGVVDHENDHSEPEADVDNTSGGDLSRAIKATVEYCEPDGNGGYTTIRTLNNPDDYTLADLSRDLQTGFLVDGDDGESGTQAYPSSQDAETQNGPCMRVSWECPTDVGNEIQTDSVEFDVQFAAMQERHNPDPANPFVDESYSADYDNDGINQPIPGGVLNMDVSYGAQEVVYAIEFDESASNKSYNLYDPDFAGSNFSLPFDADDDGIYDFQIAWDALDNDEFHYSGVDSTPNWDKDTSAGWSTLPDGFSASKNGNKAVIAVPRSALDAGGDDSYIFGFMAGAGGEQPSVSVPQNGPYSSNDNFTASENGQSTTLK